MRFAATRAYHQRRSKYLEMAGDHTEAVRERDEAKQVATDDAFDLFLIGRELTKRSEWKEAIPYFERASRQSDQFWAQCLLAICHLQQHEPSKALLGLSACLHEKPDCVWLYLLRGIANAAEGELARELARSLPASAPALTRRAADRFDDAEADYATAITLLANKPENRELHYALLVNRGIIRLERRGSDRRRRRPSGGHQPQQRPLRGFQQPEPGLSPARPDGGRTRANRSSDRAQAKVGAALPRPGRFRSSASKTYRPT